MNPAHEAELEYIAGRLHGQDIKSVLEIGVRNGISLAVWADLLPSGSRIVAVDLPNSVWGADSEKVANEASRQIAEIHNHDVHMIFGDSHDEKVVEQVRELGPYDFCYIDADHSYEGVRADWMNYGPMCRIVAFDDIATVSEVTNAEGNAVSAGVSQLWADIKNIAPALNYELDEFISVAGDKPQGAGIVYR